MPRRARIIMQNQPHHIIQRGHNRDDVFFDDEDFHYYFENLRTLKQEFDVKVYAFCLMKNHIHLILDPGLNVDSISLLMKRLSGRQTRYTNKKYHRTGTIWESRFKSSPIETKRYLLACCRFVELNPKRNDVISEFENYTWSSYIERRKKKYRWIDICNCFDDFGRTHEELCDNYRNYLLEQVPQGEWELIRDAITREKATGNRDFVRSISELCGLPLEERKRGRPRKIIAPDLCELRCATK